MEKSVPELLDLASISAKHWRVIILKTGYCKISFEFFYYKSVASLKLLKKPKSYQMHIYTVNHDVSYEVIMVDSINPLLKKYVYARAYYSSREAAKIGHQIKQSMITYLQNNPRVPELWNIQ